MEIDKTRFRPVYENSILDTIKKTPNKLFCFQTRLVEIKHSKHFVFQIFNNHLNNPSKLFEVFFTLQWVNMGFSLGRST